MARKVTKETVKFVIILGRNGETLVCLPKDVKTISREFFGKDSGRDKDEYIFYNIYENHVWLTAQMQIESWYEERDE